MTATSARRFSAIVLGKLVRLAARAAGRGGTALPGLVAEKLAPDLLPFLAAQLPEGSVVVTGTNGKTTTARMIAHLLRPQGYTPLRNAEGSNLIRGLATTLVCRATLGGKVRAGPKALGIFEVDEATLPAAIASLSPKTVLVTNLFRDQLDRYGEVDRVRAIWGEALSHLSGEATLVLNADDPLVASLGRQSSCRILYYGVEDPAQGGSELPLMADVRTCLACGGNLSYSRCFYGHLGHYRCGVCGAGRPQPHVALLRGEGRDAQSQLLRLRLGRPGDLAGEETSLSLALPGLYNVYNALGAAAVGVTLGVPIPAIVGGLESFSAAFGRYERIPYRGRVLILILIKNPVGCTEVLRTIAQGERTLYLLLLLNDNTADGRDVSWIWDVDFSPLSGRQTRMVVSGRRAEDLALRLKYAELGDPTSGAGSPPVTVQGDLRTALETAVAATPLESVLYVLPTYTALLEVRGLLTALGAAAPFWEGA